VTKLEAIAARDAALGQPKTEAKESEQCESCGGRDMHRLPCRQYERELLRALEHAAGLFNAANDDRRWLLGVMEEVVAALHITGACRCTLDTRESQGFECSRCKALALLTAEEKP
jgi:hypothetical protein